jgi:hypothetical protein
MFAEELGRSSEKATLHRGKIQTYLNCNRATKKQKPALQRRLLQ